MTNKWDQCTQVIVGENSFAGDLCTRTARETVNGKRLCTYHANRYRAAQRRWALHEPPASAAKGEKD